MKKKNILIICLGILSIIGFSYAYWRYTGVQTNKNVAVSKCLELSMDNQKDELNLTNIYPISDEEGRSLKPYTFTLTNTCTMSAEYSINLEMLEGTTMNSKYLATLVNNGDINLLSSYDTTKTIISGSIESRALDTGILTPGASKEYSISLWMDKSVTLADDAQNKSFKAKVVVNAVVSSNILDKILSQVDMTGKCLSTNDDDSITISVGTDGVHLCMAEDDYGTSYYYRGNVSNNYVKFGGFYWRIMRVNGDGSIRVIYDGTSAHTDDESSDDRMIGTSAFNSDDYGYDNAYVGYMYGTPGSSTYEETHANINDSTIKKYIDTWYENNIKGTTSEKYIVDNLFCNDRSFASNNDGEGIGRSKTYYRLYEFIHNTLASYNVMLTCPQKNDAFTVNDTTHGNGNLKYPIGLITADEVTLYGAWNTYDYVAYQGQHYWTATPSNYGGVEHARYPNFVADFFGTDYYGVYDRNVNIISGVKPVINLSSEILSHGDGTMNNPYTVE